jgi:hypothetical protein
MNKIIQFIDNLIYNYQYRKLPHKISEDVRQKYLKNIPSDFCITGNLNCNLYTKERTLISVGYNRIVVGDYGAYIEIDPSLIIETNIHIKQGQEYRYEKQYNKVKYYWLTAKDNSDIKIYLQKRKVTYADYKPKMYYVSPYEVQILKGDLYDKN